MNIAGLIISLFIIALAILIIALFGRTRSEKPK
jgi:hypothetical protein